MPPRFTCFISYPRLDNALLMRELVDDLGEAVREMLKLDLGETELFIDVNQLKPGAILDDRIADAICDSLCMIVVYVPLYEKRPYCLQEYEAMERLEAKRAAVGKKGLIIPVIYRGSDKDLPAKFTGRVRADLRKFIPTAQKLLKNVSYYREVEKIAQHIVDVYKAAAGVELCTGCAEFKLVPEVEIKPWRELPAPAYPR